MNERPDSLITYTFHAHATKSRMPTKAFRKWDGKTPYAIHPSWCALTLLTETTLSEELRTNGAQALLFLDLLEDTTFTEEELREHVSSAVVELVNGMTFESSDEEMRMVWSRSKEVKLLKVYDKVSNLLDGSWMSAEKRERYAAYLLRLCDEVEAEFGQLNITRIARAISRP